MVVVTIQSVAFPRSYIGLDGTGLAGWEPEGGGDSGISQGIATNARFELISNSDGTVSFRSIAFPNCYLRASGLGVPPGTDTNAGGIVNAQFGVSTHERYFIREQAAGSGSAGLELAAWPGRYLRLQAETDQLNVQGVMGVHEVFYIIAIAGMTREEA